MELKRKCAVRIEQWYKEEDTALLVTGARQVGKTHLIRQVLADIGCHVIEINLIETPEAISILQGASNVDELILGISTISNEKPIRGETVFFFDEIQRYKEMITKIKFLVDEGGYRYVLSGSLLGVELTGLSSAPVGYMSLLTMYPLDFEEFLQITNIDEEILKLVRLCFLERKAVMEAVNRKLLELFTRYLMVGGMPQAVKVFAESNNISSVMRVHRDIANLYKLDFTQYEYGDKKLLISSVYDLIPAELLKQNRRFYVTDIKKGLRYDRMESTFLWLEKSGVVISAYNATEPRLPLKLNEKHSLFKLYMADVGMLTSIYGMSTKRMLLSYDSSLNAGGIYENVVAQELYAKEIPIYYYNSNRLGELDFVIEYEGKILPIEVKSGKDYTIHSAINNCLKNSEYGMNEAFVFANCNVKQEGKVTYLPVYMAMFLDNKGDDITLEPIRF